MAYREKTAWLALTCMVIAYGLYFPLIALRATPPTMFDILWLFGPIAGTQGLAVLIGSIVIALASGREARVPADERDRAISRRAASAGYYVLLTGAIVAGVVMPFSDPPWRVVNTALLAIVIAEAVRWTVILLSYRRGWNG